jgi:16S rRNA processing protein RimM
MAAYDPETLSVGVIGRPHGVRGDFHFRPHNAHSRAFDDLRQIWIVRDGQSRRYEVVAMRPVTDGYVTHLAGVDDREAAAALTLGEVRVARVQLPPLSAGEYFVEDVVGCAVEDEDGRSLGVVRGTLWNGAQDVATVDGPDGRERLVPLVPDFVLNVDVPARRMQVRWRAQWDDGWDDDNG